MEDNRVIEPCPFCGKTPVLMGYTEMFETRTERSYCVRCSCCKIQTFRVLNEEAAVDIWNNAVLKKEF